MSILLATLNSGNDNLLFNCSFDYDAPTFVFKVGDKFPARVIYGKLDFLNIPLDLKSADSGITEYSF